MIIIDGDYPMAHNGLKFQRDLTKPISEVRSAGIINSEIDISVEQVKRIALLRLEELIDG